MANSYTKRWLTSVIIRECKTKPQWDITSHLLEWLESERWDIPSVGEKKSLCTLWGYSLHRYYEEYGVPQKIKNSITIWSSNPTSGVYIGRKWNHYVEEILHPHIHCSIIYNSQDMEASWASLVARTVKNLPAIGNAGDLGMIPGLGKSPAEGNGNPLQGSCLENPMLRGAWRTTVHGVAKNQTQLSD